MAVGSLSTAQQAAQRAYFIKALRRGTDRLGSIVCDFALATEIVAALETVQMMSSPGDIINLSFGGSDLSGMIEMKVEQLLRTGRVVVAAAGNERAPVSYPPANIPDVITVGATDSSDARWVGLPPDGTNFGPEVAVFGPGAGVHGITDTSDTDTRDDLNGTSISAPLVAGLALHGVANSYMTWPPPQLLSVAQLETDLMIAEGVSRGMDVLPVMRGRPLEKSSPSGIGSGEVGIYRNPLAADSSGEGLWRGKTDMNDFSLGRLQLGTDGFPSAATFQPMRVGSDESCPLIATFDYFPGDFSARILVGCFAKQTSYVGFYGDQGQVGQFGSDPDDIPWRGRIDSRYQANGILASFGGVVGLRRSNGIGGISTASAELMFFGQSSGLGTTRASLTPRADHQLLLEDVAVRCGVNGRDECAAYALTTQPSLISSEVSVIVYRVDFEPSSPRVISGPNMVAELSVVPDIQCLPPIGLGVGARGIGLEADDDGQNFSVVYSISTTAVVNGMCVPGGGTYVARAGESHVPEGRRMGEGVFVTGMSYNLGNRTFLLTGQKVDRSWEESSFILAADRALYPRAIWLPPFNKPGDRAQASEMSTGYKGFFLQVDGSQKSSVRWFEP